MCKWFAFALWILVSVWAYSGDDLVCVRVREALAFIKPLETGRNLFVFWMREKTRPHSYEPTTEPLARGH
jgi:hypothetical protein